MDDGGLGRDLAQVATGGISLGSGLYGMRWIILWLTGRTDRREKAVEVERAELDQGWKAYRLVLEARLDKQDEKIDRLEKEVEECHGAKRETEAKLTKLQAYVEGEGQARQAGAVVAAYDRLIDVKRAD